MRTAAELGFDDSRYAEVPDDIRELDPVGRSLMREERRAALEAQATPQEGGEAPQYQDEFDSRQQPAYDNGQGTYQEQPAAYGQQTAYEEQQHAYDEQRQPAYDEQYFAPNGDYPTNGGYPEPSYAEPVQETHSSVRGTASETFSAFEEPSYQDDWPKQNDYQGGYRSEYAPEPESSQAADVSERNGVGFDRPGPAPSAPHALTDAGLPRRGSTPSGSSNGSGPQRLNQDPPAAKDPGTGSGPTGDWRSNNDERWQQASQLKKPKAGGVTSSGLPRRVPKANLVEGAAETTHQGGPQVSRAPEDVRGRLSNLRRGVERGRNAGSETNGRGFGPDSTYNQER
jgi:hypothetical protein